MATAVPPLNVWLVRHGQSTNNAGLPTGGQQDVPLTEAGIEQSRSLARRMQRRPDLLVTSPFLRATDTARVIQERWPDTPCAIWPIQEITYLSPARCLGTTVETRQPFVLSYWRRCDPSYLDGPDAESFAQFIERVRDFGDRLRQLKDEFVVVVGHGQFFRAYCLGLASGLEVSANWMRLFRETETENPMANCEVIALSGSALGTDQRTVGAPPQSSR